MTNPFDIKVIGKMDPSDALKKLEEIGEIDLIESFKSEKERSGGFLSGGSIWPVTRAWQYTSHSFGYIKAGTNSGNANISFAGSIDPDENLKNARIKITLDRLRIADYPGGSRHHILFDFFAQNQTKSSNTENLHFSSNFVVQEGQQAALIGFPVFIGLSSGEEGVNFRCLLINVKNEDDEKFLGFLNSDIFKSGLKLVNTFQPALAPFSELVHGVTKGIAGRNKNIAVQDIHMGLDFSSIATRAKLAEGSYIAVQIPEKLESLWDWDDWHYNINSGQIVNKSDPAAQIPYNYVVFGISKYNE